MVVGLSRAFGAAVVLVGRVLDCTDHFDGLRTQQERSIEEFEDLSQAMSSCSARISSKLQEARQACVVLRFPKLLAGCQVSNYSRRLPLVES